MTSYDEVKAIKEEIGEKFKGRKWFLGVGISRAPGDVEQYAVKILCSKIPFFCRVPRDGEVDIIWEKVGKITAL